MSSSMLVSLFNEHLYECMVSEQYEHFTVDGVRYVRCDNCDDIFPVSDCVYYGGADVRMLCGGCRSCFSRMKGGAVL